ncbi:MAG: glutaredoxin family protein, partial [Verrucomicrobia bacterium]
AQPAASGGDPSLPLELRQAAARYPVTLYTAADCPPCDSGRKLLQQRGIPYSERRVTSDEDAQALERLVGGRTVPSLTIGAPRSNVLWWQGLK